MKQYRYLLPALLCLALQATAQNVPNTDTMPPGTATVINPPAAPVTPAVPNSIRTYIPVTPDTTNGAALVPAAPSTRARQSVTFKDGFNRPFQTVMPFAAKAPGQNYHLVQLYDNTPGQERYQFLPYAAATTGLQASPFVDQKNYYLGQYPEEGYTSYSRTRNTSTGGERSVMHYAPGKSQVGQNRGTKTLKVANLGTGGTEATAVRIWGLDAGGLPVSFDVYAGNELFGTETLLPGRTGANDITSPRSRSYTDKDGRLVVKMVADSSYGSSVAYQKTYYVYDGMGHLRYTLPPKAVDGIGTATTVSSELLDNLCFEYRYDNKGRQVAARKPGEEGFTEVLYDRKERVVMRRSPHEAENEQWEVSFYDRQGRLKATSLYSDGDSREKLQSQLDGWTGGTAADLMYYLGTAAGESAYPGENAIAGNQMMSYTYYDNYKAVDPSDVSWATYNSTLQFTADLLTTGGAETPSRSLRTQGMVTGTRVRILPSPNADIGKTGEWKYSVIYYDDKGRVFYTATTVQGQGQTIRFCGMGTQYDFSGRPVLTKQVLENYALSQPDHHTELSRQDYDNVTGSLIRTLHKVDDGAWTTMSTLGYDQTGRLSRKVMGESEVQDYSYNIRGQLTGINEVYARTGDRQNLSRTFGESLYYDYGFKEARYDGKIAGMRWRGSSADDAHAYGYSYDLAGRLKEASYQLSQSGGDWDNSEVDYSVSNLNYDRSGNILSLNRRGVKPGQGPVDMDLLSYNYEKGGISNRLESVADEGPEGDYGAGDLQSENGQDPDYSYDRSGNLTGDANKQIDYITYNHLDKPVEVRFPGGTVEYSYDAAGGKIQEIVSDEAQGVTHTTDYVGNFVYRDDSLKYILTPEGRTAFYPATGVPVKEEFFVKDHLGNVRSVVDVLPTPILTYLATYEIASAHLENLFFDNIDSIRDTKPGSTDPDDTQAGRLNGAEPERRVGTSMLMHVMAGDQVSMNVNTFNEDYKQSLDNPVSPQDMIGSLITTLMGGAGGLGTSEGHDPEMVQRLFGDSKMVTAYESLVAGQTEPDKPKAYLNYMFFDENMHLVPALSGAFQAGSGGTWTWIGTEAPLVMRANGYLTVYLSNRNNVLTCSTCGDVYFDELTVQVSKSHLLEETHYYPFGQPIAGIGAEAEESTENRHKYQGNEYTRDLGLNWMDFHARQYDPQIGRFLNVDPLAASGGQDRFSPYAAMGNMPESMIDPNGEQQYIPPSTLKGQVPNSYGLPDAVTADNDAMITRILGGMMGGSKGVPGMGGGGGASSQQQRSMTMNEMVELAKLCPNGTTVTFHSGTPVNFNTHTNQDNDDESSVVTIYGKKPGFFGKAWSKLKRAGRSILDWAADAFPKGTDIHESNDKTFDKDGGGIMFTGEDGQNEEGRSVGDNADKKSVNVDDMMFLFSHGGSGGIGNFSDGFESFNNFLNSFTGMYDATGELNDAMDEAYTNRHRFELEIAPDLSHVSFKINQYTDTNGVTDAVDRALDSISKLRR